MTEFPGDTAGSFYQRPSFFHFTSPDLPPGFNFGLKDICNFDYYVFEHEFLQTNQGNKNDFKFLEAQELFLQLKEAGCGYCAEKDEELFICPNPIVSLDEKLEYHSIEKPAIYWKGGLELFYLYGVNLRKSLWDKVVKKTIKPKEVFGIRNIEKRMVIMKYLGNGWLLENSKARFIHKGKKGAELYRIDKVFSIPAFFVKYKDTSTDREYISGIEPSIGEKGDADECMGWKFYLTKEQYLDMTEES